MIPGSPLVSIRSLSPSTFGDLERLFAQPGCSFARGCWCMEYRIGRRVPDGERSPAEYRKGQLQALAAQELTPGLIGYDAAYEPIGWVAVGPRESLPRLQRSPVMKPLDEQPAWVVPCFVVPARQRARGVAGGLLRFAVEHARAAGATRIEGFPVDRAGRSQAQWLWHGTFSMFERAGFRELARRKPERPMMRLELESNR